jgi:hypothetical protein
LCSGSTAIRARAFFTRWRQNVKISHTLLTPNNS